MRHDEIVQAFVVIDQASPVLDMRLAIIGIRFQAFVLRNEILVFAEKHGVFLGPGHVIHELLPMAARQL